MKTQPINQQSPGPLTHEIENSARLRLSRLPENQANRRLLASAYTALDKAGRELGIDAATLAERIDISAIIQAAQDSLDAMKNMPQGCYKHACRELREVLEPLQALKGASQ